MMKLIIIVIIAALLAFSPIPIVQKPPLSMEQSTAPKTSVVEAKQVIETPTTEIIPATPEPVAPSAPSQPVDNETIAWNFFISQGFTREQTAGIMGNLQQEHGFNTSDVPGGLGIAQWMNARRDNLMARDNYLDINVQLQFLMDELNTGESSAKAAVIASGSVESATQHFQNKFERCNPTYCHLSKRINYAYQILSRH